MNLYLISGICASYVYTTIKVYRMGEVETRQERVEWVLFAALWPMSVVLFLFGTLMGIVMRDE